MGHFDWPAPWSGLDAGERAAAERELSREPSRRHPLHGHRAIAVARRTDSADDYLFLATNPGMPVCHVHLTWNVEDSRWFPEATGWRSLRSFRLHARFPLLEALETGGVAAAMLVVSFLAFFSGLEALRAVRLEIARAIPASVLLLATHGTAALLTLAMVREGRWRVDRRLRWALLSAIYLFVPPAWRLASAAAGRLADGAWTWVWVSSLVGVPAAMTLAFAVGIAGLRERDPTARIAFHVATLANGIAVWNLLLAHFPRG